MTKTKSTKRALLMSALALLMCVSMLIGSTFAWFTDSVTSAGNIIQSGTLDVDLVDANGNSMEGKVIEFKTADGRAQSEILWEPGCTYETNPVYVVNKGNLALKYNIVINGIEGDAKLLEAIEWTITVGNVSTEAANLNGELLAGEKTEAIVLSGHMKEEAGNEYQDLTVEGISIAVFATQLPYESDSFDNQYDADAKPVVVYTAEDLADALTSEDELISVILGADVDLPISSLGAQTPSSGEYKLGGANTKTIDIDLNGKLLNITTNYWSGIGAKNADATITIKNGSMTSSQPTGTWNSYDLTFANCNYVFENVVFEKAVALSNEGKAVSMKNVTINETHDYYALWITAEGQNVSIDGLTVNSLGRGIKIDEQYVSAPEKVTLNVSNATFNTNKKAAIMVKSAAGADIILNNVDISNTPDATHAVWVDEDSAAYYDLVTVTGGEKIYEGDMTTSASDLQAALDAATDGTVINLGAKITGNVTATQKAGVNVTINGNGNTFDGTLLVDGKSATYTSAGLTIKNIKFVGATADACIQLGKDNLTRYTCNVTVENCTFDAPGKVGVKSYTGGDKNVTIKDCTATAKAHSLVQLKGVDGVLVENCEVYSKNGINLNNSNNVTIKGCTVDVKGYAVRFGEGSAADNAAETYTIKNCTLKSANDDGDATIVLRGTAACATLKIENTTIEGTPDITNTAGATVVK